MQDRSCQIDENLLQRTAAPYMGVKMSRATHFVGTAGLP